MSNDPEEHETRGEVVDLPTRPTTRRRPPSGKGGVAYMPPRGKRIRICDSLPPKRPFGGTPEQWADAWKPAIMAAALSASGMMLAATYAIWV